MGISMSSHQPHHQPSSACPSAIISMPIYGHIISMSSHQPHHQPSSACPSAIISMPTYGHSHIISHHQHAHQPSSACPYMGISSACPYMGIYCTSMSIYGHMSDIISMSYTQVSS